MDTHGVKLDFGRHKDKLVTRVPFSYLSWMVNEFPPDDPKHMLADAELKRRGTKIPTIQLSAHAIDRFSQRRLKVYLDYVSNGGKEGLYTWLAQIAAKAYESRDKRTNKGTEEGITFAFEDGHSFPVVKTVL